MISSMTSFSRQSHDDAWGTFVWEIRGVNHRFLEISLRVPDIFRDQEMAVRDCIKQRLSRGKVDASLKFIPGPNFSVNFTVNNALLEKLSDAEQQVRSHFPDAQINASDILSWKGVLQTRETENDELTRMMLRLLDKALIQFAEIRQREGKGLNEFLQTNCKKIASEAKKVQAQLPEVMTLTREKLQARLSEIQETLDPQRLEQEMVIFAQRIDVAEELQRLNAHLEEVDRVLKKGGVVGRRLDFLMQELNREANTLSSKSMNAAMTQSAVEMKVLIEQMREQVQNIE